MRYLRKIPNFILEMMPFMIASVLFLSSNLKIFLGYDFYLTQIIVRGFLKTEGSQISEVTTIANYDLIAIIVILIALQLIGKAFVYLKKGVL